MAQEAFRYAERITQVQIDLNLKLKKIKLTEERKAEFWEVVLKIVALLNSGGGLIKLIPKDNGFDDSKNRQNVWIERFDSWIHSSKETPIYDTDCYDFKSSDECLLCFVSKAQIRTLLTKDAGCILRRTEKTKDAACILRRTEKTNKKLESYNEFQEILNKRVGERCICDDASPVYKGPFKYGDKLTFSESLYVEFKHLSSESNLTSHIRSELSDNIVSFANTEGGTVYFGVKDDGTVLGQLVSSEQKDDISKAIEECINSKTYRVGQERREADQDEKVNYWHEFYEVENAPQGEKVYNILAVHICKFSGTVFKREPPECPCVNDKCQIVNMDMDTWISHHITLTAETDKFKQTQHGATVYRSVKESVEEIANNLIRDAPAGSLVTLPEKCAPSYAGCSNAISIIQKYFKDRSYQGYAFVEKTWNANLKCPDVSKPSNVICDVCICSPDIPLTLVTLYGSDGNDDDVRTYNLKMATNLKVTLSQEAGCLEKFFIVPLALCVHVEEGEQHNLISKIFEAATCYPPSYNISKQKYQQFLHALMILMGRSNSPLSHEQVGIKLFNLLTSEQYNILHGFYGKSRGLYVQIEGPPGSGKTIIALERIRRLRHEGCAWDEVLFLCSHDPLANLVRRMQPEIDQGNPLCRVMTYTNCDEIADDIKHIVADEIQNCEDNVFSVILESLNDTNNRRSVWLFFDFCQQLSSSQNPTVKRDRLESLHAFVKRKLTNVMRNSVEIHDFMFENYWSEELHGSRPELAHDFKGDKVLPYQEGDREDILTETLQELIDNEGHKPESITVLCANEEQKKRTSSLLESVGRPYQNSTEELEDGHGRVILETLPDYSGMENNIIIGFCSLRKEYGYVITDPESQARERRSMMLMLCSRARLKLILIGTDQNEWAWYPDSSHLEDKEQNTIDQEEYIY